jgi:ATP adenylyltransferase
MSSIKSVAARLVRVNAQGRTSVNPGSVGDRLLRNERECRAFMGAAYNTAAMDHLWTPWRYAYVTGADRARPKLGVPEALAAWPGDLHCVFCNMIAAVDYAVEHGMPREQAEAATYLLERGRSCFMVLNAFPYNSGHLMVVPYRHEQSLAALPLEEADELLRMTRRAERVLQAAYQPNGMNFGLNLGKAAGAGVAEHLHLHGVPRWLGDNNYMSVLAETRILPEMLDESWRRLRAALATDTIERP